MSIDCMKQGILIYHKYRKFSLNLIFDLNKPWINHLPLIVYNFDYTITTITDWRSRDERLWCIYLQHLNDILVEICIFYSFVPQIAHI